MASFSVAHNFMMSLPKHNRIERYSHADFGTSQALIQSEEGGYQANPSDTGNYYNSVLVGTNFGISAPVLAAYLGTAPTASDMQNLSYSTALQIYQAQYWNAIQGDSINSQDVANITYDCAVNQGQGTAKSIVAGCLNGSYNITDINNADPQTLFNCIQAARAADYTAIGGTFLSGWLNRLESITFTGAVTYVENNITGVLIALGGVLLLVGIFIYAEAHKHKLAHA